MISSNVAFEQQQQQQTTKMPQTEPANRSQVPAKVTKIRRSRQPRNPQLSVARRNERERNRVKMVNNGFALLREHLPVEDLKACEQSGSDTPTPGDSKPGKAGAKKFSKVETLRAAIQRIRMLEELIRSTEPEFESINIVPSAAGAAAAAAYELGEEPLSEPLSCGSASSQSAHSLNANHQIVTTTSHHHYEHFVKLEPHHQQQVTSPANQSQPSPQNSQHSHTSGHHQYNQAAQEPPSHTHLWIQQHQSSFLEQQQQHYQQQHWYQPQTLMDQKSWFMPSDSPDSNNQMGSQQQQHNHNHHHLLSQQQQQLEPVWFQSSPGEPLPQMAAASSSQPSPAAFATGHSIGQHHQISLYSQ